MISPIFFVVCVRIIFNVQLVRLILFLLDATNMELLMNSKMKKYN
jgi:hypothetical protein